MAGGRPCMLVTKPTLIEDFAKHVELGLSFRLAAQLCLLSEDIVYVWLKQGKELAAKHDVDELSDDPPNQLRLRFFKRVKEAEAVAARNALVKIQVAAGSGSWQASAWLLERRYPDEYGRDRFANAGGEQMNTAVIVVPGLQLPPPKDQQEAAVDEG